MAADTSPPAGRSTPPVASVIAVAWPVESRAPTSMAMTRIPADTSASMVSATVGPSASTCWGASPNQTMMRVESVRNPTLGSVASELSATSPFSGMSQPPDAPRASTAFTTAVLSSVTAWSSRTSKGSNAQCSSSRYSATPNCAVGRLASTSAMMSLMLVFTSPMATPMLPVVSARKTMSGFGGISSVVTVVVTSKLVPGSASVETTVG